MKRNVSWLVGSFTVLVAMALLCLRGPAGPRDAMALDNPAESRLAMLAELRRISDKLDRLIGVLESGKVKVAVSNAEDMRAACPVPAATEKQCDEQPRVIIRHKAD